MGIEWESYWQTMAHGCGTGGYNERMNGFINQQTYCI